MQRDSIRAIIGLAAGVVLLSVGQRVNAQTTSTESFSFSPISNMQTDFSLPINVPQFDPTFGTLLSAQLSFTGNITTNLTVTNNASSSSVGHANTKVTIGLTDPNGYLPNPAFSSSGAVNAGGFATVITSANDNYSLASGATAGPTTRTGAGSATMTFNSGNNAIVLTELTGNGSVVFNASTFTQTTIANSGGNTSAMQSTTASVNGTVVYTYAAAPVQTPEPLSSSLLLLGSAGICCMKFRKH